MNHELHQAIERKLSKVPALVTKVVGDEFQVEGYLPDVWFFGAKSLCIEPGDTVQYVSGDWRVTHKKVLTRRPY